MRMTDVIRIDNLTKTYGKKRGVTDLSLTVKEGEIFGFIGPNGAGKSTTIRSMLGFLNFEKGKIEILGKDTTKVQFNYFTDGKGNHEKIIDLGFDASQEFHTYGFEWTETSIKWFVDGKEVHSATENIPKTPGRLMMNVWNGKGVDAWLNPYDGTVPLTAEYQWARFTAAGGQ